MTTTLLTVLLATQTSKTSPIPLPAPVRDIMNSFHLEKISQASYGPDPRENYERSGDYVWKGTSSDQMLYRIDWQIRDRNEGISEFWDRYARKSFTGPSSPFDSVTPSGNALGERIVVSVSPTERRLSFIGCSKEAFIHVNYGSVINNLPSSGLSVDDAKKLEGATRWIWATLGAVTMKPQQVTAGGIIVSGLSARSGILLGNAREWATKKGWSYRMDNNSATATLGDRVVIPLASPQVRIGEDWKDLPHVTPVVGTDPYLPVSVLEAL